LPGQANSAVKLGCVVLSRNSSWQPATREIDVIPGMDFSVLCSRKNDSMNTARKDNQKALFLMSIFRLPHVSCVTDFSVISFQMVSVKVISLFLRQSEKKSNPYINHIGISLIVLDVLLPNGHFLILVAPNYNIGESA
jgi:hypothetical protein